MKRIYIEKVTLNVGAGKDQNKLEKAKILLKDITGIEPVKTFTNKRIPTWGLRPGLPIGCKITLRKEKAEELLKRLIEAKDHIIVESQFDKMGTVSFGIHEYIDIPGLKYNPKIGMMGLQVCITLARPGYRIKRRSIKKSRVSSKHVVTKDEAMGFMKEKFGVKIGE